MLEWIKKNALKMIGIVITGVIGLLQVPFISDLFKDDKDKNTKNTIELVIKQDEPTNNKPVIKQKENGVTKITINPGTNVHEKGIEKPTEKSKTAENKKTSDETEKENDTTVNLKPIESEKEVPKVIEVPNKSDNSNFIYNKVFVANYGSNNVSVFDSNNYKSIAIIPVGNKPYKIAANEKTGKVYVTNSDDNTISLIEGKESRIVATSGDSPRGIAVNPYNNKIYVANYRSDTISVINENNYELITSITVGKKPIETAVNIKENKIYVSNIGDHTISVVDGKTNTVINTISVLEHTQKTRLRPSGIAVDEKNNLVIVSCIGTKQALIINGKDDSILKIINTEDYSQDVALNIQKNRAFVLNDSTSGTTLSIIDVLSKKMLSHIKLKQRGAKNISINKKTNKLFIVNEEEWTMSVINANSGVVTKTFKVGIDPRDVLAVPSL